MESPCIRFKIPVAELIRQGCRVVGATKPTRSCQLGVKYWIASDYETWFKSMHEMGACQTDTARSMLLEDEYPGFAREIPEEEVPRVVIAERLFFVEMLLIAVAKEEIPF